MWMQERRRASNGARVAELPLQPRRDPRQRDEEAEEQSKQRRPRDDDQPVADDRIVRARRYMSLGVHGARVSRGPRGWCQRHLPAPRRSRLCGMIRVVVPLAMLLPFGCGGMEAPSLPDASSTAADAASDATHTADATSDGPPVYCWEMCGAISGPDAAPPDAWVFECPVGQICGET